MDRFDLDSRNPIYDLAYSPKGGSGILRAKIWVYNGFLREEVLIDKYLPYQWSETVGGVEIEIDLPEVSNANALQEDVYNSMRQEMKFDYLTFVK